MEEPFAGAASFAGPRGLPHGSDLRFGGKQQQSLPDLTIFCWAAFGSRFHVSPGWFKPEPPPPSESSVGGLNAGLEGKAHSNSPNEHDNLEIKQLFFLLCYCR